MRRPRALPLMMLALIALLAALWAGLVRLGWALPPLRPTLAGAHGPLMISGFLGTVIALERAVALGWRWTYAVPLATGVGGLILVVGLAAPLGSVLVTLGSLGLVALFVVIFRRDPAAHTATMSLGALAWLLGNLLWLAGLPVHEVVLLWTSFLVLTIAGERLELSRLLRLSSPARLAFLGASGLLLVGALLAPALLEVGARLAGAGAVILAGWLLLHDVATRTIRRHGLARFIATSLLLGYFWLGVGGVLYLVYGGLVAGVRYDAALHAILVGFVVSMLMAHAPIVVPSVLGRDLPFRPAFYAHLSLLHLSLALRVIGDLSGWLAGRQWGGLLNVVAILLFLASTVLAARSASRRPRGRPPG